MQTAWKSPLQKPLKSFTVFVAHFIVIFAALTVHAADFNVVTEAEFKQQALTGKNLTKGLLTTEFKAPYVSPELQELLVEQQLSNPPPDTSATRALQFTAYAPLAVSASTLANPQTWQPNDLAKLFVGSVVHINQSFANGINGQISTPTNIKLVGPSSLDCELALRMLVDEVSLGQVMRLPELQQVVQKHGSPVGAFVVETKNCNIVFRWTYQVALVYPSLEVNKSQLFIAGKMFIKNDSLQKLKLAFLFSSPKSFFEQRLLKEFKAFTSALEQLSKEKQP